MATSPSTKSDWISENPQIRCPPTRSGILHWIAIPECSEGAGTNPKKLARTKWTLYQKQPRTQRTNQRMDDKER